MLLKTRIRAQYYVRGIVFSHRYLCIVYLLHKKGERIIRTII